MDDARQAQYLSVICGTDLQIFGRQMISMIRPERDFELIIMRDSRQCAFSQGKSRLLSIEVSSFDQITPEYQESLFKEMAEYRAHKQLFCMCCLVCDVSRFQSLIFFDADADVQA